MKKITLLFALFLLSSVSLFSERYLVELGSAGAATWRIAASGETNVNLTTLGQSLNAWLSSKTFVAGDDVWLAAGTYTFTASYSFPTAGLSIYGGFAGTESTLANRVKGTEAWGYTNETILDGNNTKYQFFTPGGARAGTVVDGLTFNKGGMGTGAAVIARDGMIVQYCKFTNNVSTGNGGALLLNGGGNVNSCYFYQNKANSGGGIHCGTSTGITSSVINCLFDSNQAIGGGNNLGGALRSQASGTLNVEKCIFKNNDATGNGSAVHIQLAAATNFTILSNCLIYGNGTAKGAVYMVGGTMNNCTVVNNFAGVYLGSPSVASKLYNCVFWGTSANSGAVTSAGSNSIAVVQNTAYTSIQSANLTGTSNTNNILLDITNTGSTAGAFYPAFKDPTSNDWTLQSTSALVNVGQAISSVTDDIIGVTRPQGSAYDIGAYEFTTIGVGIDKNVFTYKCYAHDNQIHIEGLNGGEKVYVFNTLGAKVAETTANGSNVSLNVSKGIYLVRVANQATKIIVQ